MKKIKKLISKIIAATMTVNILPINCFALDNKDIPTTLTTYVGNSGMGNSSIVSGITIAPFTLDGDVAYCMNALKDFPNMHNYTASGSYDSDPYLRALAYYGYGLNKTNLKEKHSVTDEQARAYTQFAIWDYIETGYFSPKSYPYLDELRSLAKNTGIPTIQFNISKTSPSITESGGLQTSETITTSSNYKGTFTFPSDSNVYSVNTSGTKQNTFNIGESFKIVGTDTVTGSLTKNITVNIQDVTLLKFVPNDTRYQDFGVPSTKTTTMSRQMTLNFKNSTAYSSVSVLKTDDGGSPLQGVEFGVYSDNQATALIEKKTTGSDGRLTFSSLEIGKTYYVKETSSLTGYVMDNTIKNVTIEAQSKELSFVNTKITGQIKVIKTEEGRNDIKLKDAEFQILDNADRVVDTITTNANGEATSKVLPYGAYKVKESKAPAGYNLSSKVVDVNITEHNKLYEVSYGNEFIKGNIEIIKKDAEDGSLLSGIKFGIYKTNDSSLVEEIITDNNGVATSSNLRYGDYYIKELQAKEGYVLDTSTHNISISENLKTYPKEILNNKIKGTLEIKKVDFETKNPLENVEFLVECTGGFDTGAEWTVTTNSSGSASLNDLKYGDYRVTEIRTLDGYILNDTPVEFNISKNGEVISIEFENHRVKGNLTLNKFDSEDNAVLSDVEFLVECVEGFDLGATWTIVTNENGEARLDNLNYGKYTIKEVKTKEGYIINKEVIEFEINNSGEEVDIEVLNDKVYGTLNFQKLDKDTGETLEGATIKIEGISGLGKDINIEFESSKDGNTFELPYGEYKIYETSSPEGYLLDNSEVEFSITVNEEVVDIEIENQKIKGSLIIKKLSKEGNKPLKGAVFGLYNSDKVLLKEMTTDSEGLAVFDGVEYGKYYYCEIKAPEGYLVDLNMYDFDITEEGEVVEKTVYNKKLSPHPDGIEENVLEPLPDTGGLKYILTVSFCIVIVGACFILKRKNNKK